MPGMHTTTGSEHAAYLFANRIFSKNKRINSSYSVYSASKEMKRPATLKTMESHSGLALVHLKPRSCRTQERCSTGIHDIGLLKQLFTD